MSLIEIWESNSAQLDGYTVRQIVHFAGDGILGDTKPSSEQFREYLTKIDSEKLGKYIEECLSDSFEQSGFVLQDLVNEMGRRLDYEVENGRYRGKKNAVGFDGIWRSPEGRSIITEVKTTDAYRINLDVLVRYRADLEQQEKITEHSSFLVVVGRQDTGDLEAQIRGSRHAWDIRLLSAESLTKLVALKEAAGDEGTAERIRDVLVPREYTRLDPLIDVVFVTAEDIRTPVEEAPDQVMRKPVTGSGQASQEGADSQRSYDPTDPKLMHEIRKQIVLNFSQIQRKELLRKSKAQFWSSDKELRVCCTISKFYEKTGTYWYAYHPLWDDFLKSGRLGFLLLGCVGLDIAFAIPRQFISDILDRLNITERSDGTKYWHLHLTDLGHRKFALKLKGAGQSVPINDYLIQVF